MTRRIDPYSLRLFMTAAKEGSIARAAAREHIAASALSRRIADLEDAFGVPLFVRSARGIALTDAGQIACLRGARLEQDLQSLVREVQTQAGEMRGTLRLFANSSAVVGLLPERLNTFRDKYPLVEIALQEVISEEVIRACLDERADIGVGVGINVPTGIESWHLANDPLSVVLPPGHELGKRRSVRFADVLPYPLVIIQSGGALDRLLHARAAADNHPIRISVAVGSFDGVCRMVEAGLGIAILPSRVASTHSGSRRYIRRTLEEPWANRELRLYAPRQNPRPRAVEAMIATLLDG